MSVEFKCPSCGKKLFSYEPRMRKYSEILKKCKKCGAEYLDPRCHELAVEGIPEDEFSYVSYIVMVPVGGFLIWRGIHNLHTYQLGVPSEAQWILPAFFILIGIACIIGAIAGMISIMTGLKRRRFDRMLEESKRRMKDSGYVYSLKKLGYIIPEDETYDGYYDNNL